MRHSVVLVFAQTKIERMGRKKGGTKKREAGRGDLNGKGGRERKERERRLRRGEEERKGEKKRSERRGGRRGEEGGERGGLQSQRVNMFFAR